MAFRLTLGQMHRCNIPTFKSIVETLKLNVMCINNVHKSNKARNVTTYDALDNFTTLLSQKKAEKWEMLRAQTHLKVNPCVAQDENDTDAKAIDIRNVSDDTLNALLRDALDVYNCADVTIIIEQCVEYNRCPSIEHVLQALSLYARLGDKDGVIRVRGLVARNEPSLLKLHADFNHFLAAALWVKGNVDESLQLLDDVYRNHKPLRKRLQLMFKHLVTDVTSSRSEAVLISATKYAEGIRNDYGDSYPLSCIWQTCFLSEWFSDQQTALDLLKKHKDLRKMVVNRIPYVVHVALKNHRVDCVYRLLEVLLEYDMKSECANVLYALFDYKFFQRDLRSCSEIIQWSADNDVLLTPSQYDNFLNLLLNISNSTVNIVKPTVPTVKLKF